MENGKIKWHKMGEGELVRPLPNNLAVQVLAHFGILRDQIIGYMYKGMEFQGLDENTYKDYRVAFFGVSPDKELPTRFIFRLEGEETLHVWHIVIQLQDVYDSWIEATWSTSQCDFIVTVQLGRLDTLNQEAMKFLADGLALLRWAQGQLKDRRGRKEGDTKIKLELFKELVPKAYRVFIEREEREPSDWEIPAEIEDLTGISISERTFYRYMENTFGSMQKLREASLKD